ncbi:MAG: response regulator [Bacteroidales bacterium]|nr:response regulator [Bacteroidales bacterium]
MLNSLRGVKVLLVEDNKMNVLLAKQILSKWEIEIDIAENGKIAVEKIKDNEYNLVLMDLNMPEMNGYEATKAIRNLHEEKYLNLPIIALTASRLVEIQDDIYSIGMNDCLSKPFRPIDLYSKILRYSEHKEYSYSI